MGSPSDRRYLDSHEWHQPLDGLVRVGISHVAVDELTDLTYLEVTVEVGATLKKGEVFGEVESVKATSELYCGLDGELVEVNAAVTEDPSVINQDPYDQGWIIAVRPSDPAQLDSLMDSSAYDAAQH